MKIADAMITIDDIKAAIRANQCLPKDAPITDDALLGDKGLGIDSLSRIEIAMLLDEKFRIGFTDDDVKKFHTPAAILALANQRRL